MLSILNKQTKRTNETDKVSWRIMLEGWKAQRWQGGFPTPRKEVLAFLLLWSLYPSPTPLAIVDSSVPAAPCLWHSIFKVILWKWVVMLSTHSSPAIPSAASHPTFSMTEQTQRGWSLLQKVKQWGDPCLWQRQLGDTFPLPSPSFFHGI